ncbi:MAG TPA: hypothetical protein VM431_00300 [Phycisphaerae bacterium]|nr:hypothetical protein [Phycisphaerae bacterium]
MKVAYVGGGSFRVIGVVRELLKRRDLAQGAAIALYDLDERRVRAMANLLRQVPEAEGLDLAVTTPARLDEALDGADFVEVTCCPWHWEAHAASCRACHDHGWIGSDNLSPNGAYLALRGGPLVLDVARRLERLSPGALLLVFTNPIAILTSVVHQGTSIRAVGICAGEMNHAYDLSRMMGFEPYRFDFDVEVAGVNHMSWLKAVRLDGRDFYPALDARLARGLDYTWLETDPDAHWLRQHVEYTYERMVHFYRLSGAMLFSSEGDGLPHVTNYGEFVERSIRDDRRRAAEPAGASRRDGVEEFIRLASADLPPEFWTDAAGPPWRGLRVPRLATSVRIIEGVRGGRPQPVTASYRNQDAIPGFGRDLVTEYTMRIGPDCIEPAGEYPHALPPATAAATHGLVEFQALAARAVVEQSRRTFEQALYAYPMCRDRRAVESFMKAMAEVNRDELPAWLAT